MSENLNINKSRTAVLILDYQNEGVNKVPLEQRQVLVGNAKRLLEGSRKAGVPIIYVVLHFREGYPEVNPHNKLFSNAKAKGRLREGTFDTQIYPEVAPLPGEIVLTKRRVNAFTTTELETILKSKGITTLAILGIITSGCVLSAMRHASDLDYEPIVMSDACYDWDEEVHRVLIEKVFPRQATIATVNEFLNALR